MGESRRARGQIAGCEFVALPQRVGARTLFDGPLWTNSGIYSDPKSSHPGNRP